ncbi:MAG TPA: class I SAM-dependent methyltransferase [Burkholderiaceae bacterium]|nr:class I SAM-dependent methyltransferase [Burkholderiaceae bacterium]
MANADRNAEADAALLELGTLLKRQGYRHITVTPATHARVNARPGNEVARDVRDVFGWSRPFSPSILPANVLELMERADVLTQHGDLFRSTIRASTIDGDLFFHSAYPTDQADAVFFGPDTYRYLSALQQYLRHAGSPVTRAADIGCGAGPAAVLLARHNVHAEVLALDINDEALRYTRLNARLANVSNVTATRSNLLGDTEGEFDLIVSNPPYMADEAHRHYRDGGGALGSGLSVAIVEAAITRLREEGSLLLYTGVAMVEGQDPFLSAVTSRLRDAGFAWHYVEMDPDVFGEELESPAYVRAERIAAVVLTATRDPSEVGHA